MSDQVKEIKQKADIVSLISERVKLKKAGRNFQALCPFHSEKTPSFNVSPELQMFKCFGCGESGDVFSFLEKYEGMEFPEALKFMADKVGVKLKAFKPSREHSRRETWLEILNLAAEFYHYLLTSHSIGAEARGYLKNRGIWKRTIEKFGLGYAPSSWEVLQKYLVGKKRYSADDLERVGLVIGRKPGGGRKSAGYYDRFRGRVMFPLKNQRGQVVGFSGRLFDKGEKGDSSAKSQDAQKAKYINTPETQIYHKGELLYGLSAAKQDIKRQDEVIVVEGELDVLSSWQVGVGNIVAIKGSALTEAQLRLIGKFTRNLILALDADQAGEASTKRGISLADKLGMNVRVVLLSGGKDPDEIAQESKTKWKQMVKKNVNIYDFYLKSALGKWDKSSGEGKRKISGELVPLLAGISNQVEQAHYIGKLARELSVGEEAVRQEMDRVASRLGREARDDWKEDRKEKEEGEVSLDEYVLGLVFKSGEKIFDRVAEIKTNWFESQVVKKVVREIGKRESKRYLKDGEWDVGGFVESLPAELKEVVQRVWMDRTNFQGGRVTQVEFEQVVANLKGKYVRGKLEKLSQKIEKIEGKKKLSKAEEKKLGRLQADFVKISGE